MKKIWGKIKFILLILIVSMIVSIPLLWKDLNVYSDDGSQHISRAYSTYLSIANNENETVLSNLTNNFGYSWNLFYGSFSTNLILVCWFFIRNFVNAYKLTMFVGLLLSGITMYLFMKKFTKNKYIGILSATLYITMPYHLNDMYIRNAFGEFLSYIFIPLVFLGLYNLLNNEKGDFWLCIGAVGLIYTHNLMTAVTAFFAFIYLLFNLKKLKNKKLLAKLIFNLILIILITFSYLGPLIQTYFYTDYVVYEDGAMASADSVESQALDIKQLFVAKGIYIYDIGLHIVIFLILPVFFIKRFWKENQYKKEYILFFVLSLFCIFISTKYFPWNFFGEKLELLQFSWRMLVFANFFLAIVCAINIQILIRDFKLKDNYFFAVICIMYLSTLVTYIPTDQELTDIENWDIGNIIINKGQAIAGMGKGEYLPVKANDSREYIMERADEIYILDGIAEIENYSKSGQNMYAEIVSQYCILELPYIYYPGYTVTLNDEKIDIYETQNGFIGVRILEAGTLKLEYTGTLLMNVSKIISVVGVVIFIIYIIISQKSIKNKFMEEI